MGSDSEIEIKRHAKTADEVLVASEADFVANHHTVTGVDSANDTVPAATTAAATSAGPSKGVDDEAEDDDKLTGSFFERLFKFFMKATPFARAMRFILWGCFFGFIGSALYSYNPNFSLLSIHSVPSHFNCISFCLIGYGILLGILHALVIFAHKQPSLYQSSILHWITEFEEHLTAGIWVTSLLGIFANVTPPQTPADFASNWDFFLKIFLLASVEPKMHVRLCCIVLVVIVFTAVKKHFMHKLALQFNYSNYCDRVEESLFIEGILQSLNKARSAYKFRKRWKLFLTESTRSPQSRKNVKIVNIINSNNNNNNNNNNNSSSSNNNNSGNINEITSPASFNISNTTTALNDFVHVYKSDGDTLNLKDFAVDPRKQLQQATTSPISSDISAASPTFIEISSPSPTNKTVTSTQTATSAASPSVPAATTPTSTNFVTDSEKKRQFEEFSRLCNRTATQFDSLSGADIRVEIHRESRRIAAQLFKWISSPQRGDISPSDLEPFIENQADLFRFLGILRRTQKQQPNSSAKNSSTSFTEGDLRRAIDAALQERYGLAKSMETIEMALGKIDSILNFLLLVLVASLVERLFFSGGFSSGSAGSKAATSSTPSPLLSITTIFFSTSFFFKDVAKSTFESIIFLLIIHPFDIGDRVLIKLDTTDNKAGSEGADNLLVVEMNLMSTVFERWDGVRIYVPNSVLSTKPIYNIRRSGPTNDLLKLAFSHSTRIDQLEALRVRLIAFLRQNRQDYTEFHRVNVDSLENCNRILVTIIVQHASNWQDLELHMARRTKVLSFIRSTIEDLGIVYLPPVQRVQLLSSDGNSKLLLAA